MELEQRVAELERRLTALERQDPESASPAWETATSGRWKG